MGTKSRDRQAQAKVKCTVRLDSCGINLINQGMKTNETALD